MTPENKTTHTTQPATAKRCRRCEHCGSWVRMTPDEVDRLGQPTAGLAAAVAAQKATPPDANLPY